MAVRRGPKAKPIPQGPAELLVWSRHRRVPAQFLEHSDPEVRALAVATDQASIAYRQMLFLEGNGPRRGRSDVEVDRKWANLVVLRRRYAEPRGLAWQHPDPSHGPIG